MNGYHAVIMLSGRNDQGLGMKELSAEPKAYQDFDLLRISQKPILIIITR